MMSIAAARRAARRDSDEGILIRTADIAADLDVVIAGARWFIRGMGRQDIFPEPDSEILTKAVKFMLTLPGASVHLAEHDGRVIAGDAFLVSRFLWDAERIACEGLFWWCGEHPRRADAVRLLRKARKRKRVAVEGPFTLHSLVEVSAPDGDGTYPQVCPQHVDKSYQGVA